MYRVIVMGGMGLVTAGSLVALGACGDSTDDSGKADGAGADGFPREGPPQNDAFPTEGPAVKPDAAEDEDADADAGDIADARDEFPREGPQRIDH
jgi:hypothetical protein